MKRLSKVFIFIIMMVTIMSFNVVNAASTTMQLSVEQSDIRVEDTISVYLSLQAIDGIEGITAVGGFLEYDVAILEYKGISKAGDWSDVQLNEANGKFIATHNSMATSGNILKIDFTVLRKPESGSTVVTIKNFDPTDNETEEIVTQDASVTIEIGEKEQTSTNPDDGNNQNKVQEPQQSQNIVINTNTVTGGDTNTGTKGDTTTAPDKIPQTGTAELIIISLVVAIAAVSTIIFVKYKNTKIN